MEIPEEILVEILVRLPADSLMRFKRVSRLWSSLISSRYFTNLFFKFSSSTNPKRRVFVHWNYRVLFSSSLCNLDATSSFLRINHHDLTLLGNRIENGDYYRPLSFVNAMRGLMCFRDERVVRIINFTTRQILNLPQVESNILMESDMEIYDDMVCPSMLNYLGYDPVNDEYKVLSTISEYSKAKEGCRVRSETQVLVLGAGASWRNTKSLTSPPPHLTPHNYQDEGGISINGVLYYGASTHENGFVLMSFDFSSEDYNLIKLPKDHGFESHKLSDNYYVLVNLMNYQDQIAVFDGSRLYAESIIDLWVLEYAGKSIWSHKIFDLSYHQIRLTLNDYSLKIRGTSRSGEITLCSAYGNENKSIIYDLERNHIKRVVGVEPLSYLQLGMLKMNIWDDVESIMYLEV